MRLVGSPFAPAETARRKAVFQFCNGVAPRRDRYRLAGPKSSWCMIRCMRRTNIYLEDKQTEKLDRLASEEGVSRAELIRRLLNKALVERDDDLPADLTAIEKSFAVLEQADVFPRERGEREEHLARMWRQST